MNRKQEVFTLLHKLMLTFVDLPPEQLTEATEFARLNLESLDFVEIQVELDKNYGVKLDPSLFAEGTMRTIGQLASYVADKIELIPSRSAA